MSSVPLEEAQAHLPQLLDRLQPGEILTITDHGQMTLLPDTHAFLWFYQDE